jgi:prepilin-type processing-associated H-X9-DG protein
VSLNLPLTNYHGPETMEEFLIGYLLDALDERTKRQLEAYLTQHPEARQKLTLLKRALAPLAADADAPAPPPQLVERTLAKVAEHICADRRAEDLPQAPPVSPATLPMARSWWRRADVLVAACLLVTIAGLGLIVLGRMRGPDSGALLVECKNNLRQYFVALQKYREQHGKFPDIAKQSPRDVAGIFVPMLADAGTLPASASIRCPGIGSPISCQFTLAALRTMNEEEFAQISPCLATCYAYSLGFRDEAGAYHGPGDIPQSSWSQTPIMADRPPAEGILNKEGKPSNSINHGGDGQNVLFADGHVQFLPKRTFGEDDIFLNRDRKVAAGLDATDIVLGYSAARPK